MSNRVIKGGKYAFVWKLNKPRYKSPLDTPNLFELYELLHRPAENIHSVILKDQAG